MPTCPTCRWSEPCGIRKGKRGQLCPVEKVTPDCYSAGCSRHEQKTPQEAATGAGAPALWAPTVRGAMGHGEAAEGKIERDPIMFAAKPSKLERELQKACEGWLAQRGYRRMTAAEAEAAVKPGAEPTRGWFCHLHKPQGNPLMPDLLIFDARMTRCLPVELKVQEVYQPGQREMCSFGAWRMAMDFHEFAHLVDNWEAHRG